MSRLALVIPFVLAACGGSETPAKQPASAPAGDARAVCITTFERQRECTDVFIPALVATRVKHDKPAGIAATDASGGRDALVAKANEEWKVDSTDEAIAANCDKMIAEMPPEQTEAMGAQVQQCLAAEGCQAFVDCLIPVIEGHIH